MDGLLLIDKPRGPSSFDVVRLTRRAAGTKKVGHTGTLDPDASGLLGVAIGKCTKLAQFVVMDEKVYTFEIVFGIATDSDDAMGKVIERGEAGHLKPKLLDGVLPEFTGDIEQVPPIFSAIRVEGKKAYELARKGEIPQLKARPVVVHDLALQGWSDEESSASLRVRCGSGTYVRSLARDIGARLGTVAHARSIRRVRVGPFDIEQAVGLNGLGEVDLARKLLSPAEMVASLPRVTLDPERQRRLGMGQRIVVTSDELNLECSETVLGQFVAAMSQGAELIAVTLVERVREGAFQLKPKRVLMPH